MILCDHLSLFAQLGVNRHQEKTAAALSRAAALEEKNALLDPALVSWAYLGGTVRVGHTQPLLPSPIP